MQLSRVSQITQFAIVQNAIFTEPDDQSVWWCVGCIIEGLPYEVACFEQVSSIPLDMG
jgi:hypothetical protein